MRNTFADTLLALAKKDKRLLLLTGDLGFSVFETIIQDIPDQYINCGMIEQSMTGIAAGLASEGYLPVIYSIVPFITMRNFEQIRNDICYQDLPVLIVGVGAGYSYGPYGHTHHGVEDMAILRTLPNLRLFTPGDPYEVTELTKAYVRNPKPTYLRIGKKGEPILHTQSSKITIGKAVILSQGNTLCLIACSTMLQTAVSLAKTLKHISTTVISIPTLKPFDAKTVIQQAENHALVATLEEGVLAGGLGSTVAELFADNSIQTPLIRFGVPDQFAHIIGPQDYMLAAQKLSPEYILSTLQKRLEAFT